MPCLPCSMISLASSSMNRENKTGLHDYIPMLLHQAQEKHHEVEMAEMERFRRKFLPTDKNQRLQGTHIHLVHIVETSLLCSTLQNLHVLMLAVQIYSYHHRSGPGWFSILLSQMTAVFVVVLAGFDCLLFSPRSLSVSAASFLLHSPLNHFAAALPPHRCLSVHREVLWVFVSRCTCVSSLGCLAVMSVTSEPCPHSSVVGWLHFGVSASADSA